MNTSDNVESHCAKVLHSSCETVLASLPELIHMYHDAQESRDALLDVYARYSNLKRALELLMSNYEGDKKYIANKQQ